MPGSLDFDAKRNAHTATVIHRVIFLISRSIASEFPAEHWLISGEAAEPVDITDKKPMMVNIDKRRPAKRRQQPAHGFDRQAEMVPDILL